MSGAHQSRTPTDDASTGQLVTQLTEDISTLVRDEVALAKRDIATAGKRAGLGVGLFGAAGALAWFGVGTLIAAAVLALATAVEPWLAAVIVAAALLVLAGITALIGKSSVQKAPEPPRDRVESLKADVSAVKGEEQTS